MVKVYLLKEIDEMLMKDKLDLAVHSMKDLPAKLPDQLTGFSRFRTRRSN